MIIQFLIVRISPSYSIHTTQTRGEFCRTKQKHSICKYKTVDTSIEHSNSGQSTTAVKGCMYVVFDMEDTAFSYGRVSIVC